MSAIFVPRFLRQLRDVLLSAPADGEVLAYDAAGEKWVNSAAAGGGAPTAADYLVGTAQAGLSAEIVVGAAPGGELGGTWAVPTVDATHSGSSHAVVQAAAEATAAAALSSHAGAADPHAGYQKESEKGAASGYASLDAGTTVPDAQIPTTITRDSELSAHEADTTGVHGIADTATLALSANHPTNATFNDHSARHENGGADEMSIGGLDGVSVELAAHIADATAAHTASVISVADTGALFTGTDVEAVLVELEGMVGGGEARQRGISQTGHALAVEDVVRFNGTNYVKAQADSAGNAEVVGLVAAVADANNFTLHYGGRVTGFTGLTTGTVYFLDDDTAGLLTATPPSDPGDVSKPVLVADSATSGYFFNYRGIVNAAAVLPDPYIHIRDEKAANTDGGTFTSGAWQTRVLNTEVVDTDDLAVLAANQITLEAGTYDVLASGPASNVGRHKARLQNITDAATLLLGVSVYVNNADAGGLAMVRGRFTIAAQKVIELQHRCQVTSATIGFGVASNFAVAEVYGEIELRRVGG